MERLRVRVDQRGGVVVVSVAGPIDVGTVPDLQQRLNEAAVAGTHLLVVDLAQADHVDEYGLGVLLAAHKRARAGGGRLVVAGARGEVAAQLERGGLLAVVTAVADVPTAIESLTGG